MGNLVIESLAMFVWEPITQLRDTVQSVHCIGGLINAKWKKMPVAGGFFMGRHEGRKKQRFFVLFICFFV
jgi:hypothetical protein